MTPTALELALHGWVVAGTGLDAAQVMWAVQKAPRPAGPFVSLRLTSRKAIGQDWVDASDADPSVAGAEIVQTARGTRSAILTLQAFSGDPLGASSSTALLQRLVDGQALPSQRARLLAAGAGLAGFDPVQSTDGLVNTVYLEPRAITAATFHLTSEVSETGTVIETAQIDGLFPVGDDTVPVDEFVAVSAG